MGACFLYASNKSDRIKPEDTNYYDILLSGNGWELEKMVEIEEQHELDYLKEPRTISKVIPIPKRKSFR